MVNGRCISDPRKFAGANRPTVLDIGFACSELLGATAGLNKKYVGLDQANDMTIGTQIVSIHDNSH